MSNKTPRFWFEIRAVSRSIDRLVHVHVAVRARRDMRSKVHMTEAFLQRGLLQHDFPDFCEGGEEDIFQLKQDAVKAL